MNTYLYMFVDYDGVVKTYAEGFPTYHNREQAPFSHSMIRVLSYIAWESSPARLLHSDFIQPGKIQPGRTGTNVQKGLPG